VAVAVAVAAAAEVVERPVAAQAEVVLPAAVVVDSSR